jgi:secretion/DNA translocation related TadE-like protein
MSSRTRTAIGQDQRGIATTWAVVLMALLGLLTYVVVAMAGVTAARHRAEAAADLAALAGAVAARDGSDACDAAAAIARANRGALASCSVSDQVVLVSVSVSTSRIWGRTWQQVGVARAGPADFAQSRGSVSK